MIRINLLPDEFRIAEKKALNIPILKSAIIAGVLFSVLTVVLYIDFIFASMKLNKIQKEWVKIQPQFMVLNQLRGEVEGTLKQENDFMENFVTTQRSLAGILTWASQYLPDAAWLTELKLSREKGAENLLIKGLALSSKEKSSIEYIEDYMNHLKEQFPEAALNLTTTRQKMEGVEMTQFIANFDRGKPKTP